MNEYKPEEKGKEREAFSLLSLGATSDTRRQVLEALGFGVEIKEDDVYTGFRHLLQNLNNLSNELDLNIANALFIDQQLNLIQKFKDDAKAFYQSEVMSVDFLKLEEAKNLINNYVEEKTNGLIEQLLSQLDPDTVMVLINTLYFKGSWQNGFNVNHTREEDFHVDANTVVKVQMMNRKGQYHVAFLEDSGCTVVRIPYKGNVSAIVIIPKKGKLQEVEKKAFQEGLLSEWIKELKVEKINLSIPKISISQTLDLKKELMPMGFGQLFSKSADLSGISKDGKLEVSQATHKAVMKMDEEGTKAAAVTSIGVSVTSIEILPEVKADRPFIITLVTDTNTTLFTGRCMNPNK